MAQQMFADHLVNKICCSIMNRLLAALDCFSTPITDLHQLSDGVTLVELIECFEDVVMVRAPQHLNTAALRVAIHRHEARSNIDYLEAWLNAEGIQIDAKRSIGEMFAELNRSNQELSDFLARFQQDTSSHSSTINQVVEKQQMAVYARSIAYISALCYAIISIFTKNEQLFKAILPGYHFQVQNTELLHILFYTKWKLTEEELLLKDLEFMRLKDECDLLQLELRRLTSVGDKQKQPIAEAQVKVTKAEVKLDSHSVQTEPEVRSVGSVSLSTISLNTCDASTLTHLHGYLDHPLSIVDITSMDPAARPQNALQTLQQYVQEEDAFKPIQCDNVSYVKLRCKEQRGGNSTDRSSIDFQVNKRQVEQALTAGYSKSNNVKSNCNPHSNVVTSEQIQHSHSNSPIPALYGRKPDDQTNPEEMRNRILIARLLAELSYERNKNIHKDAATSQLKETNVDYV